MLRPCFFNDCPCAQPAAAVYVRAASHGVWMVVHTRAMSAAPQPTYPATGYPGRHATRDTVPVPPYLPMHSMRTRV